MSEIMVTVNGKKYTLDEAESLGLIPKKTIIENTVEKGIDIEIIVDEDTKSFRLIVNGNDGIDIPKSLLIDAFEVSGYKGVKSIIEEDGVDDDTLEFLAESLGLI